jgi:hypothetical protein
MFATRPFRAVTAAGIAARSLGRPAAAYPGRVATDADLMIAVDRQQTRLALPLNASDTSMTVLDPSSIGANNLLTIDAEIVKTTGAPAGNVVPISRGFDGTTPVVHLASAVVSGFVDAWHHNALTAEVEAIEQALGPNLSRIPASTSAITSAYNFAPQTPGGSLTVGTNAITLTPVPPGVNGSNTRHYLYISGGTGAAEAVLITGGSAVGGSASGAIFVTCANAHTGAWTIGSATSGGQEAIYSTSGPVQVLYPAGNWDMFATLYYPRDAVVVSGVGLALTKLTWQRNIGGDLIYADGPGGSGGIGRIGIELRHLSIYSTVIQTAGSALHCFACQYPIVYNVHFEGHSTLFHGIWFDQLDFGYVDGVKLLVAQECLRVNGTVGVGLRAGLFITNSLLSSSAVGVHLGGGFGGLYITTTDIIANGIGLLVDTAFAADHNREIVIDGTTSIDSSGTAGIDLVNGLDNGYLGLTGTWIASGQIGIRIRSAAGPNLAIVYVGGVVFNHSVAGIQNENDQGAKITVTGTMFRNNAIGINQTAGTAGATLNFITTGLRFEANTTDISGQTDVYNIALVNGQNNNVPRGNNRIVWIVGPTAPFSVTGITDNRPGDVVTIYNGTGQQMTIVDNSPSSAAANRINTLQGNLVLRAGASNVTLLGLGGAWVVTSSN